MADTLTAGQRGAAAARRYARFMDESSAADAAAAAAAANAASSLEARPSAGAALLQQVEQERKMARMTTQNQLREVAAASRPQQATVLPFLTARPPRHIRGLRRRQQLMMLEATSAAAAGAQTSRDTASVRQAYENTLSLYYPTVGRRSDCCSAALSGVPEAGLADRNDGRLGNGQHCSDDGNRSEPASPIVSPASELELEPEPEAESSWEVIFDSDPPPLLPSAADGTTTAAAAERPAAPVSRLELEDTYGRLLRGAKAEAEQAVVRWERAGITVNPLKKQQRQQQQGSSPEEAKGLVPQPPAHGRRSGTQQQQRRQQEQEQLYGGATKSRSPRYRRRVGHMPGKTGHWIGANADADESDDRRGDGGASHGGNGKGGKPEPVRQSYEEVSQQSSMLQSSSWNHGHSLAFGLHSLDSAEPVVSMHSPRSEASAY